ncbi:tRNA-dihydrouridine synthase [Treponema vincentii]|uniref:tRNA-dihydrouridine synthase n=1 Tax=Treponema vincentii TaxID=69710 RepID=UPI0022AB249F|nr:tRNA-dihydrouridine synthase [Treponema vincentii]
MRANPVPEKLVWQLTSPKAEAFAQAIPVVLQHGGIGVDLNMGCSAPPIVRTGAGVAWMLKPLNTTAEAVRSVKQALEAYSTEQGRSFRLSVKLRLGAAADYAYLLRFCTMLIDEGVQLITIHPRLQRQSYARPALHEYGCARKGFAYPGIRQRRHQFGRETANRRAALSLRGVDDRARCGTNAVGF